MDHRAILLKLRYCLGKSLGRVINAIFQCLRWDVCIICAKRYSFGLSISIKRRIWSHCKINPFLSSATGAQLEGSMSCPLPMVQTLNGSQAESLCPSFEDHHCSGSSFSSILLFFNASLGLIIITYATDYPIELTQQTHISVKVNVNIFPISRSHV